jgi:CubicO group peptidase (beta-lactamase class C family)
VAALRALYAPSALPRRSAESRERSLRVWWTDYGALEAVRVDTIRPHSAVITVREARTRGWGQLYVDVDTLPPHHVTGVALIPSVEPPAWPMAEAELAARVGGLAEQLHADGVFDGVVLVTRHGVPLLARAVGLADREAGRPHRLQTPFELASVGKMFTAVAVARLIEQGRLRADATVAQVLPDYPRGASASVTMHQLLTMSSGVPDLFRSPRFWRERTDVRSLTDYWRFFATDSLEFRPGTRWSYSNSNFLLLGAVVERVAGVPFQHFVEEQVFRRAGMRGTTYHGARLAERAAGYSRTSPGDAPGTAPMPGGRFRVGGTSPDTAPGGPAGGGASTAGDLAAFGDSLMRHRLLADSTVRQLFAPHVRAEYGGADGWGFETRTWNGVHIVGHGGAFPGVSNQVDYFPALGIAVVVLSNVDGSGAQAIATYARALISRRHGRTP